MNLLDHKDLERLTGYKRPGDQKKALALMGIRFFVRPDGKPVVALSAVEGNSKKKVQKPNLRAINE